MTKQAIKDFLLESISYFKENTEGCRYLKLGRGLYLVTGFTRDSEFDSVVAKIAYNCDDLQCDYDFDWYMPTWAASYNNLTDEIANTEMVISEDTLIPDTEWFYDNNKILQAGIKSGDLILG